MKDLIEALNRAHQLDESSSEWFNKMKSWLNETGAEEEEFFWSDYHDYVDDIYGRAIEKVTEDYEHINVEFEFSTQAGRGMCQVFGNDDDGSGEYTWDFRDDRDAVFEFVNESTSVEELFNSLVDYLSGKVDCIQWEDNDDYDDEEDFDEALNRAHKLDESNQDYRWFSIGEFKTPERNYVGLWSNLTSKLYVITSDNRIPAQDKKNWMFETTDYNAAEAKLDEIAPQKKYPTGSEVTSLSDIQQFAGCDDFDWTDCTSNLKRTEKQKVLNIVTNNFTLPDGIIRVEWPITAQRIAETLRLHYKNVEVDNNYRVGYHKESAIFYDTPIQGSLDETMDVMVDPENKSKPFAGDYRALLKMGLQESMDMAHELDESSSTVRVPSAIRDYVDAYCSAINKMPKYNENYWDRGTGGMFFMYSKKSSAYADRVMQGVCQNYDLTKEQVDAVYEYVEFEAPTEWYDDPDVKNEFVKPETDKRSDAFSAYKKYLSGLCSEIRKKYGLNMFRTKNVGSLCQEDGLEAVVECQPGSYIPVLSIKLLSAGEKKLKQLKLTSDVTKDARTIVDLLSEYSNVAKSFWLEYDGFINRISQFVDSTQYMKSEGKNKSLWIKYSDGREKNYRLEILPTLMIISPELRSNTEAQLEVRFITPEKSNFPLSGYEFDASQWSKNKETKIYDASNFKAAFNDIKEFLTRYDVPTSQWLS